MSLAGDISYEMKRFTLEDSIDGTFFIQDGYTDAVIRMRLTREDEPLDIVDEMNARAVLQVICKFLLASAEK
jgi:hypothetical protein